MSFIVFSNWGGSRVMIVKTISDVPCSIDVPCSVVPKVGNRSD